MKRRCPDQIGIAVEIPWLTIKLFLVNYKIALTTLTLKFMFFKMHFSPDHGFFFAMSTDLESVQVFPLCDSRKKHLNSLYFCFLSCIIGQIKQYLLLEEITII